MAAILLFTVSKVAAAGIYWKPVQWQLCPTNQYKQICTIQNYRYILGQYS